MVLFLCIATAGRYIREPTITASKGVNSRLKKALLQSVAQKLDREVGLRVAARRLPKNSTQKSRLSTEGGDSILNIFGGELLRVKLQNKQQVSWIAN